MATTSVGWAPSDTPSLDGLPDELWESIIVGLPDADWARARATCRLWRDLADAPCALAARLARPGHGWHPPPRDGGLSQAEMLAALGRRARLTREADRRHFSFTLRPPEPGDGDGDVSVRDGPRLMVVGQRGDVRVESLGAAGPPTAQRTLATWGGVICEDVPGPFIWFYGPPAFLMWTHAASINEPLGALDGGEDTVEDLALAPSGAAAAMLLASGDVMVGNTVRVGAVRWTPWAAPVPGAPRPLPEAVALVAESAQAVVLFDGGELSGWRVDGGDMGRPWWELRLFRSATSSWRGGSLQATGDGRHLLAALRPHEPVAPGPSAQACSAQLAVVALDAVGRPLGEPSALPLAPDEALRGGSAATSSGGYLFGQVAGPWGEEARRWTLSAPSAGGQPLTALSFARSPNPIAHLDLSDDGALGAVVASRPGAAGEVALWRLDGDGGAEQVWTFKPAHVLYRSLAFVRPADDLVLLPAAGGAIVIWREPPAGAPVLPTGGLAEPGAVYRGAEAHYGGLRQADVDWLVGAGR